MSHHNLISDHQICTVVSVRMSGTDVVFGEEFDSALAAFFPDPPTLYFEPDINNGHSQDSDSETEVVMQYPDPFNTEINVQELTSDFVLNL